MAARNVNLTDHLAAFVEGQVENGRHQNASEVVREALRRYEGDVTADRERLEAIRTVIREGREEIARGDFTTVSTSEDAEALRDRLIRSGRARGDGRAA